jgi:hypothetical protein
MKRKPIDIISSSLDLFSLRFIVDQEPFEIIYNIHTKELALTNEKDLDIKARSVNNNLDIYIFNEIGYSNLQIDKLILILICTSLKVKINDINGTFSLKGLTHKIIDYSVYCNMDIQGNPTSRRYTFCKKSKSTFLNWLSQLKDIEYPQDEEKFTSIVTMLIKELYNSSPNKSIGINMFLDSWLNKYINVLAAQKNCYLGIINLNYFENTINAEPVQTLIKRMESCDPNFKKVITININYQNGEAHINHLLISGRDIWKIEPNYRMGPHAEKLVQNKIDQMIHKYFEGTGFKYLGPHQQSCGLKHAGLCLFISYFKVLYGNQLTDQILKDSIISFLKWALKNICSDWNTVKEKIL